MSKKENQTTLITSKYVDENGKFRAGNDGRPKGATNRTTRDLKQFITNFLNEKAHEIPTLWETLEDKDKLSLFMHLSRLILPKSDEQDRPDIILMDSDERKRRIAELKEKLNDE